MGRSVWFQERQSLSGQCKNFEHECDSLRDQLDEEAEAKSELQRQLSKANADIQQWRSRFENEGLSKAEELEDAKRKLVQKLSDVQEQLDAANVKIGGLDKTRSKLLGDLDDAQVNL